jgi:LysM repeat protein
MTRKILALVFGLVMVALVLVAVDFPAAAAPLPQAYYQTPTAGADGRIIYTVKDGDTCISISLLNNISMDQLRKLNNIQGVDCPVIVGQKLLLGNAQTPTLPVGPIPTATLMLPSPTSYNGNASVCIMLFEDINGNGMPDAGENPLAGGAVSITDRAGKVSLTGSTTGGPDPLCFDNVPEGDYNVSVAVPAGYNATTNTNYPWKVTAGDQTVLDFGAQISVKAAPPPPSEGGHSPMLGILGGLLVVCGLGLGVVMLFMRRG